MQQLLENWSETLGRVNKNILGNKKLSTLTTLGVVALEQFIPATEMRKQKGCSEWSQPGLHREFQA